MARRVVETDFLELMTDQVSVRVKTGQDFHNQPTYAPMVVYQCWIESKQRVVRGATGEQVTIDTQVTLAEAPSIREGQVTLPDGSVREIMGVDRLRDEVGPHHTILYL